MTLSQERRATGRDPVGRRLRVPPVPVAVGPGERASVTVVVPCFNYGRYLVESVSSVLEQPGVDVDVVVVDDLSTDDSAAVADTLAAADDRVRVVRMPENRGPVAAFNAGLEHVTGEFLVRLDADDLLTPGSLARAVALVRAHPSVGLVYGHPSHFVEGGPRRPARTTASAWTIWPGHQWVQDRCADGYNVITSAEVVMRSDLVARVGGQLPLAHTHDMEMWLRLAAFGDVGYVHGADQAWHRDHDLSLSAREVDVVVDLAERRLAFHALFDGAAGGLGWAAAARRTADAALDRQVLDTMTHELDVHGAVTETYLRLDGMAIAPTSANLRRKRAIARRAARGRRPVDVLAGTARRARDRVRRAWTERSWHRNGVY
ncbi:glycosyltransferase family 2 protein [Georgenia sp. Z1344]|uniref:glycosyltransferase family 2 protein n=1 Tax=Georgenia sp. Z1344 TaxID=3416706 RepID=UPI003CF99186